MGAQPLGHLGVPLSHGLNHSSSKTEFRNNSECGSLGLISIKSILTTLPYNAPLLLGLDTAQYLILSQLTSSFVSHLPTCVLPAWLKLGTLSGIPSTDASQ